VKVVIGQSFTLGPIVWLALDLSSHVAACVLF